VARKNLHIGRLYLTLDSAFLLFLPGTSQIQKVIISRFLTSQEDLDP